MSRFAWPVAATAVRSVRSPGTATCGRAGLTGRRFWRREKVARRAPARTTTPLVVCRRRRAEDRRGVGERLLRTGAGDLILIRVLHPGLFPQDRTWDLGERCTAGDRYEPLGSDGMWTKRGPSQRGEGGGSSRTPPALRSSATRDRSAGRGTARYRLLLLRTASHNDRTQSRRDRRPSGVGRRGCRSSRVPS